MKLVRESINFERGGNPLATMGIGKYRGIKGKILAALESVIESHFDNPDSIEIVDLSEITKIKSQFFSEYLKLGFYKGEWLFYIGYHPNIGEYNTGTTQPEDGDQQFYDVYEMFYDSPEECAEYLKQQLFGRFKKY